MRVQNLVRCQIFHIHGHSSYDYLGPFGVCWRDTKKKLERLILYVVHLSVFVGHVLQPRETEVWRILITLCDSIHQIEQHLRIFLELLHLYGIRKNHMQVEDKIANLRIRGHTSQNNLTIKYQGSNWKNLK